MAYKLPRLWWNNPDAFPQRFLYVNLLSVGNEEEGTQYDLDFRSVNQTSKEDECWFRVSDIMRMEDGPAMVDWLTAIGLSSESLRQAYKTLDRLHKVVHTDHLVFCYEEMGQDIEKVLQIFIRMNDGGTPLSYSDLLLSIAVAQWDARDAREEIHGLVDDLNDIGRGFDFSKNFVLKAGLMLSNFNVGFKVANFNRQNMSILQKNWDEVSDSLLSTVNLADQFGFNRDNLSADNALLPIADFLYKYRLADVNRFLKSPEYAQERDTVKRWLVLSLVKRGIWGSGLDSLLTALREAIAEHSDGTFPINALKATMSRQGKSLEFTDEEIEDLADMRYGDKRVFPLLSLLFPSVNLSNNFHVDHIFPRGIMTNRNLRRNGFDEETIAEYTWLVDGLANLQLLEGQENIEKQDKHPALWLANKHFSSENARNEYLESRLLHGVPEELDEFEDFYYARRERLKELIVRLLGVSA